MSNVSVLNLNNPSLRKGRSKFNLTHTSHVDMNAGLLVPLDQPIEVMPGDTFKVSQRTIVRMSNPPRVPVMDTLVMDVNYYYVPYRIVWDNWDKFITADNGTQWDTDLSLVVPKVNFAFNMASGAAYDTQTVRAALKSNGVLDFLGVPSQTIPFGTTAGSSYVTAVVRAFEIRGYYKIWNRFFRFEPLFDEILIDTSDTDINLDTSLTFTSGPKSNKLCPTVRLSGYFSRALPQPQRGEDVLMDLSIPETFDGTQLDTVSGLFSHVSNYNNIAVSDSKPNIGSYANLSAALIYAAADDTGLRGFANLQGGTINALRQAFSIQRLKDVDARYGARIGENTIGHFGVNVPDFRISEPEELAHERFDININQVVQTSETGVTSPQGNVGAYSVTNHYKHYFTKSFVEWGLIYCVATIRVKNHSFSQGIPHQYSEFTRLDYYFPELANISDTPIYTNEIYVDPSNPFTWDDVFGYQEAYAWYKFLPSRVANHMRPQANYSLAIWTYTDLYSSVPTLSASWIQEPTANIDRTMYVASDDDTSQFIVDTCFFIEAYRVMPYHSIPGGLTHEF